MCDIIKHLTGTYFNVCGAMESLPLLRSVHISSMSSSRYFWEGRKRGHEKMVCFQYTLEGYGIFYDGKLQIKVPQEHAFIVNLDDPVYEYFYPKEFKGVWKVLWCNFEGEYVRGLVSEINSRFGYLYKLPQNKGAIPKLMQYCRRGFSSVNMSVSENSFLGMELISALLQSCEKDTVKSSEEFIINRALEVIDRNEDIFLTVSQVAEELNISREHLSRVFKKNSGSSVYNYILNKKLEQAKITLRISDESIKETAYRLGFASPAHFTNIFKKHTGMSPKTFRNSSR